MRITCPHCGPRGHDEYTYHGDATRTRPDAMSPEAAVAFSDYVYLRDNPHGKHHELWFHAAGCHAFLIVERDTTTHSIKSVRAARADR
jgi:methylglutamate dehydrogenase subunit B